MEKENDQPVKRPRGRPLIADAKYKQDDYNEQKKAYSKEYFAKNKETVLNYMKEKVACDKCNHLVSRTNLVPHQKTKKCINAWNKYLDKSIEAVNEINNIE